MLPYFLLLILNFICAYFIEKNICVNTKICWTNLGIIILANTIIIGLRDFGVGIDTTLYIDEYFNYANYIHSIKDLVLDDEGYDKGFLVLAIVSHIFSDSSQSLMVATELWITSFIFIGAYEYRKRLDFSLLWFVVFFWILYQYHTENLMRQWCAVALLFYGFTFVLKGNYKVYVALQVVSFFFHSSSTLFLVVPLAYYVSKLENYKYQLMFSVLTIGLFCIGFVSFYAILSYLGDTGFFKEVYMSRYGEESNYDASNAGIGIRYIARYLIPLVIIIWCRIRKYISNELFFMMLLLAIFNTLMEQMKFISEFFFRMAHYYGLLFIIYFSIVSKKKDYIVIILLIAYFILQLPIAYSSYFIQEKLGWNYYYTSKILGI